MISSISLGKFIARSYTSASATEASTMSDESGTGADRPSRFLTERQFARRLLILSAFVLVGIILWLTVNLLLLVFASVIVAMLLHAIADPLARHTPVPEHFALAAAMIGLLVIFGLSGWFFGSEIQSQISNLGDRVPEAWRSFEDRLRGTDLGRQFLNWLETNILDGNSTTSGAGRMLMSLGSAVVGFLMVIIGGISNGSAADRAATLTIVRALKAQGTEVLLNTGMFGNPLPTNFIVTIDGTGTDPSIDYRNWMYNLAKSENVAFFDTYGAWGTYLQQLRAAGKTDAEYYRDFYTHANTIGKDMIGRLYEGYFTPVPEPTSLGLLILGGAGLIARRRKAL